MARRLLSILLVLLCFGCAKADLNLADFYKKFEPSVAIIRVLDKNGAEDGHGTGFVYDAHTIITAKHCLNEIPKGDTVVAIVGGKTYKIVGTWYSKGANQDIGIVVIMETLTASPLVLATDNPCIGTRALLIGYPLDYGPVLSDGFINQIPGSILGVNGLIGFSTPSNPGNSGGPLMDENGQVLGIVFAGVHGVSNLGVASSVVSIRAGIDEWHHYKGVEIPVVKPH